MISPLEAKVFFRVKIALFGGNFSNMAITKQQKKEIIEELKQKIARQKSIVFVNFSGVKVKDLAKLRNKMKEKGCELKVAKKTLISLAFKERKIEIDPKKLEGEIGLGFGYVEECQPFKILYDFSKKNENLKILGGVLDKKFIEKERAIEIAQLPTREELLAKLVGSLSAPISSLVNVLGGNIKGLIYVLAKAKT